MDNTKFLVIFRSITRCDDSKMTTCLIFISDSLTTLRITTIDHNMQYAVSHFNGFQIHITNDCYQQQRQEMDPIYVSNLFGNMEKPLIVHQCLNHYKVHHHLLKDLWTVCGQNFEDLKFMPCGISKFYCDFYDKTLAEYGFFGERVGRFLKNFTPDC